ncbi:MAG: triose-phosphate isomerase [Desulfosarcinaceae bacterium]|nr:triose-phosphate isomerase [Desulfosarcinaceae bacterium]
MTERTPLIAGNWKMHKTVAEALDTTRTLIALTEDVTGVDLMIAPPSVSLAPMAELLTGSRIALGAQNLHWEQQGAYTGELSAQMLASAGCSYVLIGHSERRQYFGETDETVNKRLKAALAADLIPVVCIGETDAQREAGETFSVLDNQVINGLDGLFSDDLGSLVIAYEPVWAIGTGKTASDEQAQEAHRYIRELMDRQFGKALANTVRILYGGSVKPSNVKALMAMPDVDGALVGGASLAAESFSQLAHYQA